MEEKQDPGSATFIIKQKDLGEKKLAYAMLPVLKKRSGSVIQWYGFGIRNTWSMGKNKLTSRDTIPLSIYRILLLI
jgi:hypothetical protein